MGTITRNFANNIVTGGKVDGTDGLTGTIPASNVANDTLTNLTAFPATVGDFVEVTASDVPASPSTAGQLFYNSTSGTLKGISLSAAAWSSGGSMGTARYQLQGSHIGTQSATQIAGGRNNPPGGAQLLSNAENYDGSSWTAITSLPSVRGSGQGGIGTQTASLVWGGRVGSPAPSASTVNTSVEWNGSAWTSGGNLTATVESASGGGIQTAAFSAGGAVTPDNTFTNEYDGTAWTAGGSLNTGRDRTTGWGSLTSGVLAGGRTPTRVATVEEYDGSTWTAGTDLPLARDQFANGNGTQTDGVVFGGILNPDNPTTSTLSYDGSAWTSQANLSTTRYSLGGGGSGSSSAIGYGGTPALPAYTITEEYIGPQYVAKTLTTS